MTGELNVKVGDMVLVTKGYVHSGMQRISEVTRVTPTGRIRIKDSDFQFNKYGQMMGAGARGEPCNIEVITDEEAKEFEEKKEEDRLSAKLLTFAIMSIWKI